MVWSYCSLTLCTFCTTTDRLHKGVTWHDSIVSTTYLRHVCTRQLNHYYINSTTIECLNLQYYCAILTSVNVSLKSEKVRVKEVQRDKNGGKRMLDRSKKSEDEIMLMTKQKNKDMIPKTLNEIVISVCYMVKKYSFWRNSMDFVISSKLFTYSTYGKKSMGEAIINVKMVAKPLWVNFSPSLNKERYETKKLDLTRMRVQGMWGLFMHVFFVLRT